MAQDTYTLPIRLRSSTPTIRSVAARITEAHKELLERLTRLPPNEIDPRLVADDNDLEDRADILRCHLRAVADYVSEYIRDTADHSWSVQVDRKWIEGTLQDLIQDVVGPIAVAAETVRQEGTWRAA